jgi:hypothetical protein
MTTGGSLLLWLFVPQWGITGAGVAALASGLIVACALAVILFYRSRVGRRTAGPADDDSVACGVEEPAPLSTVACPADELLLSPVVAFAPLSDEPLSEDMDHA